MKILLCESDDKTLSDLNKLLTNLGHQCLKAKNSEGAINSVLEHEPDLVLMGVNIPSLGGIETAQRIKENCYDFSSWIPIILMGEHQTEEDIIMALEAGADDFISKPVSEKLLKAKIKALRRIVSLRENLIDFGKQLRDVNDKLLTSNQLLSELSLKDPLTLLANRRAFEEGLERSCRLVRREKSVISLLMIDVDNFKPYNDTYGHQAGDNCLKQVAKAIQDSLHRDGDICARYGGEEFSVILPHTSEQEAEKIGERIRLSIENLKLKNVGSPRGYVTASIGVASTKPGLDFISESLVAAGDSALYLAKENGRNRVMTSTQEVNNEKVEHLSSYKTQRASNQQNPD